MALGDLQDPYDLIIIGRGAAAADYLLTLPRRYRSLADDSPLPLTIMVIGEQDPWAGARIRQGCVCTVCQSGETGPATPHGGHCPHFSRSAGPAGVRRGEQGYHRIPCQKG